MNDQLVEIKNNQVVVSSVDVAHNFEKRHVDVMRTISSLVEGMCNFAHTKQLFDGYILSSVRNQVTTN